MTSTSPPTPQRVAAWQALSGLFLDTQLDERDIESIARQLRATGIQAQEIQRIYEEEVAPVCWRNLTAIPGGVWSGFEGGELSASIARYLSESNRLSHWPWVKRWRIKRWTSLTRTDWERVRRRLG